MKKANSRVSDWVGHWFRPHRKIPAACALCGAARWAHAPDRKKYGTVAVVKMRSWWK